MKNSCRTTRVLHIVFILWFYDKLVKLLKANYKRSMNMLDNMNMQNRLNLKNKLNIRMNLKHKNFIVGVIVSAVIVMGSTLTFADDFGSQGALSNTNELSLNDMLNYAIQDEYAALAEYELIMEEFNITRPFSNIARAEEMHISWLVPLFDKYSFDIPVNNAEESVILPDSLLDAYNTGVEAEILNISMYEKFLENPLPTDVANVFDALMNASVNHLASFERQIDRETTTNRTFSSRNNNMTLRGRTLSR